MTDELAALKDELKNAKDEADEWALLCEEKKSEIAALQKKLSGQNEKLEATFAELRKGLRQAMVAMENAADALKQGRVDEARGQLTTSIAATRQVLMSNQR